ncbi:MAG: Clp1/GlmU family protein [Candidatus Thorarchaeota archaeon]
MIKNIEKGHTLLVKGPTRITLLEGKLEVLGKTILPDKKSSNLDFSEFNEDYVIIIPSANHYPLFALEKSKLEIYTSNEKESLKLIKENSISNRWIEIKNAILEEFKEKEGKPLKIMVLGISSGKTTIIKYLANSFLKEGFKGGYLDSDLGQQIMYLPTTLNIGTIKDSIISGEDIDSESTVFIGATFPKGNYKFIVSHYCKNLVDEYIRNHIDTNFVLIDTDGWIKQEAGVIYKNFFIEMINPDILIVFHDDTIKELKTIVKIARLRKDRKVYLIKEDNKYFYEKDKEERRFLRQSQFAKVLKDYRKISISLNDIKFVKSDYNTETNEIIEREIDISELIKLPYHYVIISLLDKDSKLIKIGLLFVINLEKNYILIFSDLSYKEQIKVKKILLGSLRLSIKGNHQGYLYL